MSDYSLRFGGIARLYGQKGAEIIRQAHICVIGIGGVGSWAAESLARNGIGNITLIDLDDLCVTNINRQIHALTSTIGESKVEVMAKRILGINPECHTVQVEDFITMENLHELITDNFDYVIDAIDNVTAKCHLINACKELDIPLVVSTGASGRWDPTKVETADLTKTKVDPLAATVRKILRKQYGFAPYAKWNIPAVFSTEPLQDPVVLPYDKNGDFQCVCPSGENTYHNCEERNVIWGTAGFVTGVFGLTCASLVVKALVES